MTYLRSAVDEALLRSSGHVGVGGFVLVRAGQDDGAQDVFPSKSATLIQPLRRHYMPAKLLLRRGATMASPCRNGDWGQPVVHEVEIG
jgi:hypothetical protein